MSEPKLTWAVDVETNQTVTERVTVSEAVLSGWLDGQELTPALAREFLWAGDYAELPDRLQVLLANGDGQLAYVDIDPAEAPAAAPRAAAPARSPFPTTEQFLTELADLLHRYDVGDECGDREGPAPGCTGPGQIHRRMAARVHAWLSEGRMWSTTRRDRVVVTDDGPTGWTHTIPEEWA